MHEASASLDIQLLILLLHSLQLTSSIDGDLPRTGLLANLVVLIFQPVDAQRNRHIQVRTLIKKARDVGNNSLLNLSVRHQINRFEVVMSIETADELRKI